jgi:hypothetical protein
MMMMKNHHQPINDPIVEAHAFFIYRKTKGEGAIARVGSNGLMDTVIEKCYSLQTKYNRIP